MENTVMRWLLVVAFALSLAALAVSVWMWQQAVARADAAEAALQQREYAVEKPPPVDASAAAEAALLWREQSLVAKHRPTVVKLCRVFGVNVPSSEARTIDELMGPLEGVVAGLSK
jgi:hypothetical protein